MHIATKSSKLNISAESDTAIIAKKFSNYLKVGDVLFLYGEIGAGKTTFVRYLVNNFQKKNKIKLSEVTSPTFNIVNEYKVNNLIIQHYDLFRIKNSEEIKNIGLLENIKKVLTIVEWPDKIKNKPKNAIDIKFKYDENFEKRFIEIDGVDINRLNEII
ncbi:MAG: tRNA threonylcarbamoyladenosine biosynthesis protein TsaE/hypothetical protein [Pelagibacterales bacterium]|nr:tRNA threonylcarbamoyladenosine biosynthesis protein TsaE/hypothetical protein [Pelagibacterales bacterium]